MNTSSHSEAPAPSVPESAPTHWSSRRRILRVLLGIGVSLVTLIALFYLEEDWRGKHAWNAYAHQMTQQGEVFEFKAVAPPPVPDDQNFAMTPFLAPLFDFLPGTQTWRDTNATQRTMQFGNKLASMSDQIGDWRQGQRTDWPVCQAALAAAALGGKNWKTPPSVRPQAALAAAALGRTNRSAHAEPDAAKPPPATNQLEAAAAVLATLKEYEPVLAELRAASQRPHSRFNIRYDEEESAGILLPHLAVIKKFGRMLALRASAELTLNQPESALADLEFASYLADAVRNEPFLISQLVRCAMIQLAMQPVWEGLADRKWTEAQLQALQQRLGKFDFLADGASAMRGERACGNSFIAYVRRNPEKLRDLGPSEGDVFKTHVASEVGAKLMPRGWFYLEQINFNRLFSEATQPGVDYGTRRLNPSIMQQQEKALGESLRTGWSPLLNHRLMSVMLLPALTKAQLRFALTQTILDEAILACALERYRLANGRYPDSPAELAPRFVAKLPHDLITGEPLKYRRTDNGRFILYSVGSNEKDDGGLIAKTSGKSPRLDSTQGDWVWPSP